MVLIHTTAKKSIDQGYIPEMILSGRKINNSMGNYIANRVIEIMSSKGMDIINSKLLVFGLTFKENCPDLRNTKVVDLINSLESKLNNITIFDPFVSKKDFYSEYSLKVLNKLPKEKYDVIILAVSHQLFFNINYQTLKNKNAFIYDIKSFLNKEISDYRL